MNQQTIKYPVSITGVGLQSGNPVTVKISPAPADTGILFFPAYGDRYTTILSGYSSITSCVLSTDIGNGDKTISTIEHLMSALHAYGIDNAKITSSGGEIPILDGSAIMWYTLLMSAGSIILNKDRSYLEVTDTITVEEDDKWITIEPYDGLILDCAIDFDHPMIGAQSILWDMDSGDYLKDVSRARTFGFRKQLKQLKKMGYLKGGDENTAIILGKKRVIGPPLRYEDEFVRHKLLDMIGDVYINGPIKGYITGYCSGHDLNSKLMRKISEQRQTG